MVPSLELFIVVWFQHIALKLLWRIWESDVKEGLLLHTFLQIFFKNIKILVISYLSHFSRRSTKNLPKYNLPKFLCNKELHKKFAPILMSCQRWYHSEKAETRSAFDLDVILACGFFLSHIFWMCFSWKNKITCFFWSAVPLVENFMFLRIDGRRFLILFG